MSINNSLSDIFDKLTDEQKARVKNCRNMDEMIALANSENYELSDDVLDSLAGGDCGSECPEHGCHRYEDGN